MLYSKSNIRTNRKTANVGKQKLNGFFKRQTAEISPRYGKENGTSKKKLNLFIIAAQNKAIKTNYIKLRIDNRQPNSKCRLCGDRDEMVNHKLSEVQI